MILYLMSSEETVKVLLVEIQNKKHNRYVEFLKDSAREI